LGLPGETKQSFQNCVYELLELGVHNGVEVNQAQMFSNAEMHTVQREIYDINTVEISDYLTMYQDPQDPMVETVSVVTSTSTMTFDDNIDVNLWVSFMQAFHFHGFATQISQFLRYYQNEKYCDFYQKLYQHISADDLMSRIILIMRQQIQSWFTHGYLPNPAIKQINFNGMNLLGGISLHVHINDLVDHVFELLESFLLQYQLDDDLRSQLICYQKNITVNYYRTKATDTTRCRYNYDFVGYIENQSELNRQCWIEFSLKPIQKNLSQSQFLENIFFKRRQRFGLLDTTVEYI
jgi:hypothetical protein